MKKVLVFGVFDRLHPGHLHFLEAARTFGDELVVIVARDSTVMRLKKKTPRNSDRERMRAIEKLGFVSRVRLGDEELGTYAVLRDENPDVIALGYDQSGLKKDLEEKMSVGSLPEILRVVLSSHEPDKYKSSLLNL